MGTILNDADLKNRPLDVLTKMEILSYEYLRDDDPCIREITCRYNNKRYKFRIYKIEVTQEENNG